MTKYKSYSTYKPSSVEWLGEIPFHWEVIRLKHICWRAANYGANESSENYLEEGIRFLRTTDIDDFGNLLSDGAVFLEPSKVADYKLADGDILISRSGTIGRSFIYSKEKHGDCAFAGYLVRFSLQKGYLPKFIFYFTKSIAFIDWLGISIIQSTISNVNGQKYANISLPIPSLKEQKSIVSFLERETTRIDNLITRKRELINLLQKKRTAIITKGVSKGLTDNIPMKDSGISWIGKIPEHWSVMRLKFVMSNIVDCLHSTPTYDEDGEYLAIRTADISPGSLDIRNAKRVNAKDYLERIARLKPQGGDIIYSREGERYGMAALVPPDVNLCLAQRVMMFRVSKKNDPTFIMWALNADCTYHQVKQDTVGATSPRVNIETIAEAWLPIPPSNEQRKIGTEVSKLCLEIDNLVNTIKNHIDIIQKYRKAIITAAVTGKIDVREEVNGKSA